MRISRTVVIAVVAIIVVVVAGYAGYSYYTTMIEKAEKEKVLIIAADDAEPITLDPAITYSTDGMRINRVVYEKLLDYAPGSVSELVPALAEDWDVSPDGLVYTFHLKKGVKFHNGEPFDATAVEYSFNRLKGIGKGPSWFIAGFEPYWVVDHIDILDPYTIRFTLSDTYADFLARIAAGWGFYIVAPSEFQKHATADDPWAEGWAYDHMCGTGPYKLSEWVHHDRVVLEKFDDYWKGWEGKHIERVIVREVTEMPTQRMLLERGEVDIAYAMTILDVLELKEKPEMNPTLEPSFNTLNIFMHCQRPPLDDVRVRRAISYAYDYAAAVETILHGTGAQMRGPLPSSLPGWDANCPRYETNLAKAKELMAEAGYPNGIERTLRYTYPAGDEPKRMAGEILKSSLAKLGITVELEGLVWAEQSGEAMDPETAPDFFSLYWWPDFADPINYIYAMFHSSMQGEWGYNWSYYTNTEVDELMDKATVTVETAERTKMLKELQRRMVEDAPSLFVFEMMYVDGIRAYVKGFVYNPLFIGSWNFYDMYKELP